MTRQCDAISAASRFIETKHTDEDDLRLVSQVHFWTNLTEVHSIFGVNIDKPLDLSTIEPLQRLSLKLDGVRADWTTRFAQNQYVGNYPRKGVSLHYHFAKLYLYSMTFRGVDHPDFKHPSVCLEIEELARVALLSATSILRAIIHDTEIQDCLNGLPTYFDIMIAFVIVFLLKVSSPRFNPSVVRVDVAEVHSLVAETILVLQRVTADMHPKHLLVSVVQGAADLLERCSSATETGRVDSIPVRADSQNAQRVDATNQLTAPCDNDFLDSSLFWNLSAYDFPLGEFDLLASNYIATTEGPSSSTLYI
jgi:hypothetical protein